MRAELISPRIVILVCSFFACAELWARQGTYEIGWGQNFYGETTSPAGLTNGLAIAAGHDHTVVLKNDGAVIAWGYNSDGEARAPIDLTNAVKIAAGSWHSVALRGDGTFIGWGENVYGQSSAPGALSNNLVSIAAGAYHSLALTTNGTVFVWGFNADGETNVPAMLTNVVAIAAGWYHSLALRSDGTVAAWGENSPQSVVPQGLSNVVAIAGGRYHSLALRSDGSVTAWGLNPNGQTNVPSGLTNVVAIASGGYHNVVLRNDGTVVSWGYNDYGQTNVPTGLNRVVGLAAGAEHSVALTNNGFPVVVRQPLSRTLFSGNPASLSAGIVGTPAPSLQWQLNGTNIAGATDTILNLTNTGPGDSGKYGLAVTNPLGSTRSSDAVITFVASLPFLTSQPVGRAALLGSGVAFAAAADGSLPFAYQWRFSGTNIAGATNVSLVQSNIAVTDEGNYDVVVTNPYGSVISSPAFLRVENPSNLASVLDATNLQWATGGNLPWFAETSVTHDGIAAAQSGAIPINSQSFLQTSIPGPGTLSFWWKISSRPFLHTLSFSVNGVQQVNISGEVDWQQQTVYLVEGPQNVQWTYNKDSSSAAGQDAAWLDDVRYLPGPTAAAISVQPNSFAVPAGTSVGLSVAAYGTPPLQYQWHFNGASLPGATNSSLTLPNLQTNNQGIYTAAITNAYGFALSSNATVNVTPSGPSILAQPTNQVVIQGSNVTLSVTAKGSSPLDYRWLFNSNTMAGIVNSSFILTNVQPANTGKYQVIVTNRYGAATSSICTLALPDLVAIAAAVDATNFAWMTWGDSPWSAQTATTHDGVDAARSGGSALGQRSVVQTTVSGPGTLSFWWNMSSSFDTLFFSCPTATASLVSPGWQQKTFYVGEGSQTLVWRFSRDVSFSGSQDAGFLDQVSFVPGGSQPVLSSFPTNRVVPARMPLTFAATAVGTPPLAYQWFMDGNSLPGATNSSLIFQSAQPSNSGTYTISITNAYGLVSSNAALVVQPLLLNLGFSNLQTNTNRFTLSLSGVFATNSMAVQASSDLLVWLPIFNGGPATGSLQVIDTSATNFSCRFYRAVER
jgi:alpha-tubulin suppressor-like RCC1 family protein